MAALWGTSRLPRALSLPRLVLPSPASRASGGRITCESCAGLLGSIRVRVAEGKRPRAKRPGARARGREQEQEVESKSRSWLGRAPRAKCCPASPGPASGVFTIASDLSRRRFESGRALCVRGRRIPAHGLSRLPSYLVAGLGLIRWAGAPTPARGARQVPPGNISPASRARRYGACRFFWRLMRHAAIDSGLSTGSSGARGSEITAPN